MGKILIYLLTWATLTPFNKRFAFLFFARAEYAREQAMGNQHGKKPPSDDPRINKKRASKIRSNHRRAENEERAFQGLPLLTPLKTRVVTLTGDIKKDKVRASQDSEEPTPCREQRSSPGRSLTPQALEDGCCPDVVGRRNKRQAPREKPPRSPAEQTQRSASQREYAIAQRSVHPTGN